MNDLSKKEARQEIRRAINLYANNKESGTTTKEECLEEIRKIMEEEIERLNYEW